jgi:cytochrome c biogenesis protein CcmG/thiol:disulfide interchange protein DsbE
VSGSQRRLLATALGVAAVGVLTLVVLAVPLGSTPGPSAAPSSVVVGGSPLLDKPLPELALQDLDGRTVRTADLRGRPFIVNIWASWCVPCREEFPLLVGAYGEYRDRDLGVLGIVRRDDPESARRFATEQGATWPMLLDPDESAYRALIGIGVPQTYFVDAEGIVRWVNIGPFSPDGLAYGISRILPPTASGPAPSR